MKLAAIYNIFDGCELLRGSLDCIKNEVDLFIIQWQSVSNYGEPYNPLPINITGIERKAVFDKFEPIDWAGVRNEKVKRNIGLDIARYHNCTHFLHMDCDEYYIDFARAKQQYIQSGNSGSCCKIFTYFKKPTLRFENEDNYYVPFIHELKHDTIAGAKSYPFYVDPTRRINNENICLLDVHMHHYSWVRNDIERKIRNSSARANINRGKLLEDYNSPDVGPGFLVRDYNQKLIEVPNYFNISI